MAEPRICTVFVVDRQGDDCSYEITIKKSA